MKQVNFLENNPQYIATAHNVRTIDENFKLIDEKINPYKSFQIMYLHSKMEKR